MKKNLDPSSRRQDGGYTIHDYGHDRTIHSLGRGGHQARMRKQRRRALLSVLTPIILLIILAVLAWPMLPWGKTPASGSDQTSASTGSMQGTPTAAPTSATIETSATMGSTSAESATNATETLSAAERSARLNAAGEQVLKLLKSQNGRFAVYFQNLQTGEKWQTNADQPFVAASSIKLGINTYLYSKIASGEIKTDEILAYDNRAYPTGDYEAGTGTIQYQPNGTKMTVRDTSGLSIRISDNCGTNMVIRRLGGIDQVNVFLSGVSGVVDYRKSVSYKNYAGQSSSGRHRSCAIDLGQHAVKLYELWQANQAVYQPLIDDLCRTEFDFGIQKGVPDGIKVAHKIGTNGTYSAENDVGIVLAEEPYVLCVMTEMAGAASAHQLQADVSAVFYAYIKDLKF